MTAITWPHCEGQHNVKRVIEAAIANNSLGHAYLFSGAEGAGKFAAALDLALILLCESTKKRPCLTCPSCAKVLHNAHPDFRVVLPVVLGKEHKGDGSELKEAGWQHIAACVKERIENPYSMPDHARVPVIPVEWIREMSHAIIRGAASGGRNVAILDGIDLMNKESSNSMLKLLEEPPAGTVLMLLTNRISAVLPTIVSRCQIIRFSWLSQGEIREALVRRLAVDADDERLNEVCDTGSLGQSLYLWRHPPDEARDTAAAFFNLASSDDWMALASFIDEAVQWNDYSRYEQLFTDIAEQARIAFLGELQGTDNVFLPVARRTIRPAGIASPEQAERLRSLCQKSMDAVKARANMTLVLSNFAIALREMFHE